MQFTFMIFPSRKQKTVITTTTDQSGEILLLKQEIERLKLQLEESSLDKCVYEEKIYIDKSKNTDIKITFMGIINKFNNIS